MVLMKKFCGSAFCHCDQVQFICQIEIWPKNYYKVSRWWTTDPNWDKYSEGLREHDFWLYDLRGCRFAGSASRARLHHLPCAQRLKEKNLIKLFYEKNPFKRNLWKYQNFAQKIWGVTNFTKEIPVNKISENPKIEQKNHLRKIRYFCTQNPKNPDPNKDFNFREWISSTCCGY